MNDETRTRRLAQMANALRPDWPVISLTTYLTKHAGRPYRDLAVALAWIAADPETKTPARLEEAGPWWKAAIAETEPPTPGPPNAADMRCRRCNAWLLGDETRTHDCRERADPDHARTMRDAAKAAARDAARPKETTP